MVFLIFHLIHNIIHKHQTKSLNFESNYNNLINLNIDNEKKKNQYENNIDYSNFSTKIRAIALYYPNIYFHLWNNFSDSEKKNNNNLISYYYQKNELKNKDFSSIEKKYMWNKYFGYEFILKQIELAKTHGIYGFGIYIYWHSGNVFFDKYINEFLMAKQKIDFHFLFILKNRNIEDKHQLNLLKMKYNKMLPGTLILQFKLYFMDNRYIKIDSKPVLCIADKLKRIDKIKSTILSWRINAIKFGIGKLFIVCFLRNRTYIQKINNVFDAGYELLPNYLFKEGLLNIF